MRNTNDLDNGIGQLLATARRHPLRWMLPIILLTALSVGYAIVHQPLWQTSQALTIREQPADDAGWPRGFNEAEQLKHAQETMLELAKSAPVITAALESVGPPASHKSQQPWPTPEDIAACGDQTGVSSPNGAEFGTTRLFYLTVSDPDPHRANKLAIAICDEAEKRFKKLREQEATNAIAELTNTAQLAEQELDKKTARLREMEMSVGSDLAELRMLSESFSGGSNLQTTLSEVKQEMRQVETMHETNQQLLSLLTAARKDPSNLVATPNRLLDAQPALRRLKDGLIDAQLASSQLLGTMSPDHPRVKAAMVGETEIRGHLHRELEVAVRGLRAEQDLVEAQLASLGQKADDLQQRLRKLAEMRAAYSNQLVEVRQQTESMSRVQQELHAAQARRAADEVTSLVTRVDTPQTGPYPQGPGRTVIAAAGLVGGVLVALGVLLLSTPTSSPSETQGAMKTATEQHTSAPSNQPALPPMSAANQPSAPPPSPEPHREHEPAPEPEPAMATATEDHFAPQPAVCPSTRSVSSTQPGGRSLTLKEALMRCSESANRWN